MKDGSINNNKYKARMVAQENRKNDEFSIFDTFVDTVRVS
jgi:hypothetical protein